MEMARTLWTLYQPNLRKNHRNSTWTTWPSAAKALAADGSGLSVLDGQLTLGQLIAFRSSVGMSRNLLRLSTIWQRIQELRVSFERLADIVDTPEESTDQTKENPIPPIEGNVEFKNLQFRFNPGTLQILKISTIHSLRHVCRRVGQRRGKSTLMKLLPRLYSPTEGNIMIDNYDIDKVDYH